MANLTNRVAVVTGAARGQGRSHAVALAKARLGVIASTVARTSSPSPTRWPPRRTSRRRRVGCAKLALASAQWSVTCAT